MIKTKQVVFNPPIASNFLRKYLVFTLALLGANTLFCITINGEGNYLTIQSAVDHALVQHAYQTAIISVEEGCYEEHLVVDFVGSYLISMNIEGSSAINCSIQNPEPHGTGGNVITVIGSGSQTFNISGFHIFNSGGCAHPDIYENDAGLDLGDLLSADITNCKFSEVTSGIQVVNNVVSTLNIENNEFVQTVEADWQESINIRSQDSTISIVGNVLTGYSPSPIIMTIEQTTIAHPIILSVHDDTFTYAGNINTGICVFQGMQNSVTDMIVRNNKFINMLVHIAQCKGSINDNKFINNAFSLDLYDVEALYIKNNLFFNQPNQVSYYVIGSSLFDGTNPNVYFVDHNTFINCDTILRLDDVSTITYKHNIAANYATFIETHGNTSQMDVHVSYNCFDTPTDLNQNYIDDLGNNLNGIDPLVHYEFITPEIGEYTLWQPNLGPSPCIDSGDPRYPLDPDGTITDMGAVYSPHHNKSYTFEGSNIFWMSFPVLDDRTYTGGQHWNELGYLFHEHMDDPPDNQINSASWSYDGVNKDMQYNFITDLWDYSDELATQPKGFKLKFNENIAEIEPVNVKGFKVDAGPTPVELQKVDNNGNGFENWIGYFVPYTQKAGDAFSKKIPGTNHETYLDHIYSIETQTWATKRLSPEYGSKFITDPNRYTLFEGDMLVITLLPNAPEQMYWKAITGSVPPRTRAATEYFSYREQLDYTPIFIEFDPDDLPEEVGLYVSGVCKGAAVVDSTLIEVNYYGLDAKNNDEIELMFCYGNKGMKKAPAASVYNPETMLFEAGSLKAGHLGEYGYISFNRGEGSSLVPLVTELKQNYPNPFKTDTKVSWILAKDAPASVDIYNLKGQKVKTLFNGLGKKGRQMLSWNGRDDNNREVASGVYFYRLNTPENTQVHKMMLLK